MTAPRSLTVPPVLLAVVAVLSVQFGNAIAGSLFSVVGPLGAAALRMTLAAVILCAVVRPRVRGWDRRTWASVVALGVGLGGMNALIYLAIDRIPLAVAIAGTRRWRDLSWVVLAAIGVALLGLDGEAQLDLVGALLAAAAAVFWALYIVASARLGPRARGVDGLGVAMIVAALLVAPWGASDAVGAVAVDPLLMLAFAGVAIMTSAIPYALEFLALKRMPTRVFGVLSSLGPAVAALAGLIVLGQDLSPAQLLAIVVVMAACAGAVASSRTRSMRISSSAPPSPLIDSAHAEDITGRDSAS